MNQAVENLFYPFFMMNNILVVLKNDFPDFLELLSSTRYLIENSA